MAPGLVVETESSLGTPRRFSRRSMRPFFPKVVMTLPLAGSSA